MTIILVDLGGDTLHTICIQLHLKLMKSVCFHLKMDMVCIMAAGEQKGLKRMD